MVSMKKKRHILEFDSDCEFDLIGICTHQPDYKLAWAINAALEIRFAKSEDYPLQGRKGEVLSFHSMFHFVDEDNRVDWFLIKNQVDLKKLLIPEQPNVDYFLFLHRNVSSEVEEIAQQLKKIAGIIAVFVFDPELFESTQMIVFD